MLNIPAPALLRAFFGLTGIKLVQSTKLSTSLSITANLFHALVNAASHEDLSVANWDHEDSVCNRLVRKSDNWRRKGYTYIRTVSEKFVAL